MIVINKNSAKNVTVTVTELSTLEGSNYLFQFKNKQTNVYNYCMAGENLSINTDRYDEFIITEMANPDPLLAQVQMAHGDYTYNIYQLTSDQVTALDFDNIDTTGYLLVEGECHCKVEGPELTNTFYSLTNGTNTVYEG